MTYAMAWSLQKAIYDRLTSSPAVAGMTGGAIFDGAPQERNAGTGETLYVIVGDDSAQDWSAADTAGAAHLAFVSVVSQQRSFAEAKIVAEAICDALLGQDLVLDRGRAVLVSFLSARTRREERDTIRRIELRFRILLEDAA